MLDLNKRKCYGFSKDDNGNLVINEVEATNVKLIFECFLSGMSLTQIAKELEERQIKSPSGKDTWSRKVLSGTLSNEKYHLNGVVDKDVFDKCQSEKSARTSSPIVVTEEEIIIEKSTESAETYVVETVPTKSSEKATGEEFSKSVSVTARGRYALKLNASYEFSKVILVKLKRKWWNAKSPHYDDFYIFKNCGITKSQEYSLWLLFVRIQKHLTYHRLLQFYRTAYL